MQSIIISNKNGKTGDAGLSRNEVDVMRVISGTAKGTQLKTPDGMLTRPTTDKVKEALFSIIQFDIPGAGVLDLFGGTGQLGIEALSRGAKYAVAVDNREEACRLIRENYRRAKLEDKARVVRSDFKTYLKTCREKFDLIFLDPPYAEKFLEESLNIITEIDILQSGGIIVAERPIEKELDFSCPNFTRSKDYKYGKILLTLFRLQDAGESAE